MALYGNNFYGLFQYGPDTLVDFSAAPFIATSTAYASINLEWVEPSGDWDLLHLVRNSLGFPVTPDDGDLLLETEKGANDAVFYLDARDDANGEVVNPKIAEGKHYYYSVFVRRTSDNRWFNAGSAIGTSVKNYGTADLMYSYLPFMYRTLSINGITEEANAPNSDLYNFIRMFAFEYDKYKTDAENVKKRYDVSNLHGQLIPALMNEFGFVYEKEMGLQQGRRLLQNAINIYSKKGSTAGLKLFASAFSGYNVELDGYTNMMLTLDDSSFEYSVGNWSTNGNATISKITGASESPAISPYQESTSPSNYPNSQLGLLKVEVTANSNVSLYCGSGDPVTKGIPVTEGSTYSFSVYNRSKSVANNVSLNVDWYDKDGVYLSSGTGISTAGSLSGWARGDETVNTAPSDARFAVPKITIIGCATGDVHYFDAAQFEEASAATDFVDSRRIDIHLEANRVNIIKNPSFSSVTTNWTAVSSSSSTINTVGRSAAGSLKAVANGNPKFGCYQSSVPVTPGLPYTWSIYVKDYDSAVNYVAQINWYNGVTYLSTSQGTSTAVTSSGWTRVSVTGIAPASATTATVVVESTTAPSSGKYAFFDDALFEVTSYLQDYFDGSTGYYELGDMLWEDGDAVNGRSLYYRNRLNVTKRLPVVLPEYLPHGAQWALFAGISH